MLATHSPLGREITASFEVSAASSVGSAPIPISRWSSDSRAVIRASAVIASRRNGRSRYVANMSSGRSEPAASSTSWLSG